MGGPGDIDKRPKIRIDRNRNPLLRGRYLQQGSVARIGMFVAGVPHVMALLPQPLGEPTAGAAVNEKSHSCGTLTASSRSFATTAWA